MDGADTGTNGLGGMGGGDTRLLTCVISEDM